MDQDSQEIELEHQNQNQNKQNQNEKPKPKVELDPTKLKGMKKVFNNQASHWLITPTFWCATNFFTFLFMLFIALGYFFYYEADKINDLEIRYDQFCDNQIESKNRGRDKTDPNYDWMCEFVFVPTGTMTDPKVYYMLNNFYGNHRSYVKSRSYSQLKGDADYTLSKCDPVEKNSQLGPWVNLDSSYVDDDNAYPCGYIAKYLFNDQFLYIIDRSQTYKVHDETNMILIDDSDIAHKVDVEHKFKYNQDIGRNWTAIEDQHLMVWYQMETLPKFMKLYGSIKGTLNQGTAYNIYINNKYDAASIGAEKYLYISEIGIFGGKNMLLPFMFLGAGGVVFCILLFYFICYFVKLNKRNRESEAFIASLKYS